MGGGAPCLSRGQRVRLDASGSPREAAVPAPTLHSPGLYQTPCTVAFCPLSPAVKFHIARTACISRSDINQPVEEGGGCTMRLPCLGSAPAGLAPCALCPLAAAAAGRVLLQRCHLAAQPCHLRLPPDEVARHLLQQLLLVVGGVLAAVVLLLLRVVLWVLAAAAGAAAGGGPWSRRRAWSDTSAASTTASAARLQHQRVEQATAAVWTA